MTLEIKLRKIGDSLGIVLPKEALAHLQVEEGDTLTVTDSTESSLRLSPHSDAVAQQMAVVQILREVVLMLHEQSLAEHGGSAGLRDDGLLDSELGKPLNQFAYGSPNLFELAASYAYGLAKNHPFIDGNKRVAFVVAITFLELNGFAFTATEADAALRTLALAAGEMTEASYATWLESNSKKRKK
jgi:death-on-curing protein